MFDLTPIVSAIIALISTAITAFLIPWLKTRYGNETLAKIQNWVHIGVFAAEKIYGAGRGAEKLEYVESFLAEHKVKLDTKTLSALVDAEIQKMEWVDPNKALDFMLDTAPEEKEPEEEEDEEDETGQNEDVTGNAV